MHGTRGFKPLVVVDHGFNFVWTTIAKTRGTTRKITLMYAAVTGLYRTSFPPCDGYMCTITISKFPCFKCTCCMCPRPSNIKKIIIIPIVISTLSPKFEDWLKRLYIKFYPSVLQKSILLETAGLLHWTLNIHL